MASSATFSTPWGMGSVSVQDGRLVEVRLPQAGVGADRADGRNDDPPADAAADSWAKELASYFDGRRSGWTDGEVDVASYGFSTFREAVYRALLEVPAGSTVTYGELARRAGSPGSARAVGSAMAENPLAVVIPCHRVVRSDGSPGHYAFGDEWKVYLLRHEGASG